MEWNAVGRWTFTVLLVSTLIAVSQGLETRIAIQSGIQSHSRLKTKYHKFDPYVMMQMNLGTTTAQQEGATPTQQTQSTTQKTPPTTEGSSPAANKRDFFNDIISVEACEVCVYVLENKEMHQAYLCNSLSTATQQAICVQVLESLLWWLTNEVYWVNFGCQRTGEQGSAQWVRPCPAHVICGWIENLQNKEPFCTPDTKYPKPP